MIACLLTNLAFWRQFSGHIHVAWQKLRVKSKKQAIQLYSPQTSKTTFHRAQSTNHSSFVLPNLLLSTLSHCSFARWNSSWAFSLFPFKDAATPAPACQPAWIVERTHPSWCMSNVSSKKLEKLRTPPGLYMLAARWQKASRMHEKNTHRMLWIVPYYLRLFEIVRSQKALEPKQSAAYIEPWGNLTAERKTYLHRMKKNSHNSTNLCVWYALFWK